MQLDPAVWSAILFFALIFGGAYAYSRLRRREEAWRTREAKARDPQATERLVSRLKALVRPTLLITPAKTAGFSKFGGEPELPADLAWPAGAGGPRTFVAQLDLAAAQAQGDLDWLPRAGRLYAFYDPERHGFADVVCVLASTEAPGPSIATPAGAWRSFTERRVDFTPFSSVPSADWLNFDATDPAIDYEAVSAKVALMGSFPAGDQPQHRIGGYPDEIQSECMRLSCEHMARGLPLPRYDAEIPPEIDAASNQWHLLLQVDSDPALNMNWGDGGLLYVFVRDTDAAAGDFSKTVAIWQTH